MCSVGKYSAYKSIPVACYHWRWHSLEGSEFFYKIRWISAIAARNATFLDALFRPYS